MNLQAPLDLPMSRLVNPARAGYRFAAVCISGTIAGAQPARQI